MAVTCFSMSLFLCPGLQLSFYRINQECWMFLRQTLGFLTWDPGGNGSIVMTTKLIVKIWKLRTANSAGSHKSERPHDMLFFWSRWIVAVIRIEVVQSLLRHVVSFATSFCSEFFVECLFHLEFLSKATISSFLWGLATLAVLDVEYLGWWF